MYIVGGNDIASTRTAAKEVYAVVTLWTRAGRSSKLCTDTEKQIEDNTILGVIETFQNELKTCNSKYMSYVCSRKGDCCPLLAN